MINTHRLFLIFFLMNILMGIVTHIYMNPTLNEGMDIVTQENSNMESEVTQFTQDSTLYSGVKNKDLITETTVGNPITWTKILFDVILKGFNPFAINPADMETVVEMIVTSIMSLLKSVFWVIMIIEIYSFFKNKKAT